MYYLLKDYDTGEPYMMIKFNGDVNRKDVQKAIWMLAGETRENEDCVVQYIEQTLPLLYDCEIVNWSCDDNLYC